MPYPTLIRELPSQEFWTGWTLATLVAATSLAGLFRYLSQLRLIEDTPSAFIRSAPQGYAELQGIVRMMPGEPVTAPLSGRPCVWYRYTVEQKQGSGNKHDWTVIERGISSAIFHLDDGTGRCIIDPDGAAVMPSRTRRWRGHTRRPGSMPEETAGLWERLNQGGDYRYTESRIDEFEPLYAIGFLKALASGDPGTVEERVGQLVRRWKQAPAALRQRFDTDRDGQISPAEWETALDLAEQEVLNGWHETAHDADMNLMHKPADRGRPFILSTLPERELVRVYRRRTRVAAILFLLLGSASGWALYLRFWPTGAGG